LLTQVWSGEEGSTAIGWLEVKTGTMKEIKRWKPASQMTMRLSWSGRYLACRLGKGGESQRKISVIDTESGSDTILIEREVQDVVGWFPGDESFLFSSSRSGATGLWGISLRDGKPAGEPELLKSNVGEISPYTFTREGSFYYTEGKPSEDVYVATVDFQTGEILERPRRLAPDRMPGLQSHPVWSKDGQKLMFVVQQGQRRFISVSMAGGERKEFPVEEAFSSPLEQYDWSQDGARRAGGFGRSAV